MNICVVGVRGCCAALLAILLPCSSTLTAAETQIDAVAYTGEPLGVGRVVIHFDRLPSTPSDSPIWLREKNGRALYPVFANSSLRGFAGTRGEGPGELSCWFLFHGEGPLNLTLEDTLGSRSVRIEPATNAEKRAELIDAWWSRYAAHTRNVANSQAYPPLVENYLTNMLAKRLEKTPPELKLQWSPYQEANQVFAIMTGAESIRIAAQSGVMLSQADYYEMADQPLPEPVAAPPIRLPDVPSDVAIEKIARRVPEECFYIRCATIADFVWLHRLFDQWGSKINSLATIRAYDYQMRQRLEKRLALREESLLESLDASVVSDVAVIGTDTFMAQGPALGVLLEAKDGQRLGEIIKKERLHLLNQTADARETTIEISGREVSILATPANEVRSFYAVDGEYHFISTSRTLVERFLATGRGVRSLGTLNEFHWARHVAPLDNQSNVFVYLSDPFFRRIVSPHYRIAMTRRTRAETEMQLAQLAIWTARAEGNPGDKLASLIKLGYLPRSFDQRPGRGRVELNDGRIVDSQLGARGSFLPIPDMAVDPITASETKAYQEFAQLYRNQWRRMDPAILQIKRNQLGGGRERISLDLHVTPYAREHYEQLARLLDAPDEKKWSLPAGTIANAQANVFGKKLSLGVIDFAPRFAVVKGEVHYSQRQDDTPAYLVGGKKELFDLAIPRIAESKTDTVRSTVLVFDKSPVWLRRFADSDVISWVKEPLENQGFTVIREAAERKAQFRLRIGDLSQTQLAAAIDAEGYMRARRVSAGNVAMLHTLTGQLQIPAEDAAAAARALLDAELMCPMGGRYELVQDFSSFQRWHSTAFRHESLDDETGVPKGYRTPLLEWLAGLQLDFMIDRNSLHTHIQLDVRNVRADD